MEIRKALIVSDFHRHNENVLAALEKEKPVDLLVHLGDIEDRTQEIEGAAGCSCFFLRGNCDSNPDLATFTTFYLGKHRVFAAHGHRHQVNWGIETLAVTAGKYKCDVALYGHTHVPYIGRVGKLLVMNPGSIALPRQNGFRKSYILLEMDEDGELVPTLKFL